MSSSTEQPSNNENDGKTKPRSRSSSLVPDISIGKKTLADHSENLWRAINDWLNIHWKLVLKGFGIIIIFYAIVALVILLLQEKNVSIASEVACRQWVIGDGVCDDQENFGGCSYDGGDCCLNNLGAKLHCTLCVCHSIAPPCDWSDITLGDGICHDQNNNEKCWYDFGDCCITGSTATSACTRCECTIPDEVLMIVGGYKSDEPVKNVEFLHFETLDTCDIYKQNVSKVTEGMVGGYFSYVNIAAGCSGAPETSCEDYFEGSLLGKISLPPTSIVAYEQRIYASSALLDASTLMISGGIIKSTLIGSTANGFSTSPHLDTVSLVSVSKQSWISQKPPHLKLPVRMSRHCSIDISPEVILFVGGHRNVTADPCSPTSAAWRETFLYNRKGDFWSQGPKLNIARTDFICGSLRSEIHEDRFIIVVAGGERVCKSDSSLFLSTEILDFTGSKNPSWQEGPNLPFQIKGGKAVTSPDWSKMIYVGGIKNNNAFETVYHGSLEFSCKKPICKWKNKQNVPNQKRNSDTLLFKVPRYMTKCGKVIA